MSAHAETLTTRHENAREFTDDVLLVLQAAYDVRVLGWLNDRTLIVTAPAQLHNIKWEIWDNGGEIGVGRVNERAQMVALCEYSFPLDAGTVAFRIFATLCGVEYRLDYKFPELVQEARELAAEREREREGAQS